jgi:hypothetical protein
VFVGIVAQGNAQRSNPGSPAVVVNLDCFASLAMTIFTHFARHSTDLMKSYELSAKTTGIKAEVVRQGARAPAPAEQKFFGYFFSKK